MWQLDGHTFGERFLGQPVPSGQWRGIRGQTQQVFSARQARTERVKEYVARFSDFSGPTGVDVETKVKPCETPADPPRLSRWTRRRSPRWTIPSCKPMHQARPVSAGANRGVPVGAVVCRGTDVECPEKRSVLQWLLEEHGGISTFFGEEALGLCLFIDVTPRPTT